MSNIDSRSLIHIFSVNDDNELELTMETLTEPYLKAVVDKYENYIAPLSYLHYMTFPFSSYNNMPEAEKEKSILETYPGEYNPDDMEIVTAMQELERRYNSPQKRFFESQKHTLEVLTDYHNNLQIESLSDDGQRGNYAAIRKTLMESDKMYQAFSKLEDEYKKHTQTYLRGGVAEAYDEDYE